ncbi:DNA mismatch repair protein MutS [Methylibium sp. Pch-M]|uniref:Smr/MutS family protein n=1 Tax=Methylibium sp. Pch-M TaxID=2082386 RepID=UPI0010110CF6|nr:Smr/MutS family protein [Methylibium sp. Pch-M]QAZ40555.1 DNA mismatch repair protein MutS [Methylibium sp. Pch-M]
MSAAPPENRSRRTRRKAVAPEAGSLKDLKGLKRRIEDAARERARREAEHAAAEARLRRERDLFALSVGPVFPLKRAVRTPVPRPKPEPVPLQRQRDEQAVLREALSDEFDVESLLDTDDALSYRRSGVGIDVVRKLRRGGWAIQAHLDLHGLRRDEARERLADFLREAGRQGLRCVRVVHGKGNGSPGRQAVLKTKVRTWLVQKTEVLAFTQARGSEGGAGALVVLLGSTP